MTDNTPPVAFRVLINKNSSDWMVQHPSGRVQFVGFLGLMRLLWGAAWAGKKIQIEDEVV